MTSLSINLSYNNINENGIKLLAIGIGKLTHLNLLDIEMQCNVIGDYGIKYLSNEIKVLT